MGDVGMCKAYGEKQCEGNGVGDVGMCKAYGEKQCEGNGVGDVGVRGGNVTHECARRKEGNSARAVGDSEEDPMGTQLVDRTTVPAADPPSAPHTTMCSVAALARNRCRTYLHTHPHRSVHGRV